MNKIPTPLTKLKCIRLLEDGIRRAKGTLAAREDMLKKLTATTTQSLTGDCTEEYDIMVDAADFEAAAAIVAADDEAQAASSASLYEAAQMNTMMAADDYYMCLENQE